MQTMIGTSDGPLSPGERVVIMQGKFVGSAGVVLGPNTTFHTAGLPVYNLVLESGELIYIAQVSLERSIYQGEQLEAVPNV